MPANLTFLKLIGVIISLIGKLALEDFKIFLFRVTPFKGCNRVFKGNSNKKGCHLNSLFWGSLPNA